MKILIADDEPVARELCGGILEPEGFTPVFASNGTDALRLISEQRIRLVIADWEMPGLSGPELCNALRAKSAGQYVYVIIVTGRNDRKDVLRGLSQGADDYLVKPLDPMELLLRVRGGLRLLALEGRNLALFSLAKLADSRDPETGKHLERTRTFCRILAEGCHKRGTYRGAIDYDFVELIEQTSPLHDIGKIGIPDQILLKPGRLTDAEFEIMKRHTIVGAETLDAAINEFPEAEFLEMARDIALCHHERWDGTGYPNKLAGDEIPLAARIMAVADVYDALRSERVYKPAVPHERTCEIITEGISTHFDPKLIPVFLEVAPDFNDAFEEFGGDGGDHNVREIAA